MSAGMVLAETTSWPDAAVAVAFCAMLAVWGWAMFR